MMNNPMKKITAADLTASGAVIQVLFEHNYPNGLTEKQMEAEGKKHGWVARALERYLNGL